MTPEQGFLVTDSAFEDWSPYRSMSMRESNEKEANGNGMPAEGSGDGPLRGENGEGGTDGPCDKLTEDEDEAGECWEEDEATELRRVIEGDRDIEGNLFAPQFLPFIWLCNGVKCPSVISGRWDSIFMFIHAEQRGHRNSQPLAAFIWLSILLSVKCARSVSFEGSNWGEGAALGVWEIVGERDDTEIVGERDSTSENSRFITGMWGGIKSKRAEFGRRLEGGGVGAELKGAGVVEGVGGSVALWEALDAALDIGALRRSDLSFRRPLPLVKVHQSQSPQHGVRVNERKSLDSWQ
ncbi:hypothetical protein B0H11DRAFT_1919995 [Mycena galericulata]|nr:hypothetical protein B0H11DRAFT_1919995 [Mycena galericulata]